MIIMIMTTTMMIMVTSHHTSFLLAPFWLKANIRNVMIYSLKLYT
jgi:hypothetical protein